MLVSDRAAREMTNEEMDSFVKRAEDLYATQLKTALEAEHTNEFVAIEPISGDFFLGRTLSEAIGAARSSHPDRLAHAMRVGYHAALHFGMQSR